MPPDSLPSARAKKILTILLAVALAIHVVSDIGVYVLRPESISTTPDPLDYRLAALNLLHYGEFSLAPPSFHAPELLRTPVYPSLVAFTYIFDGESGLGIILLQSLMLVLMGWLLFRLLIAFRISEPVTLVLVALYLFEPFQWLYTLQTMTETLSSLIVLALITAALTGKGIRDLPHAALYGVGLGLAIFEKPSALMWIPFLLALLLTASDAWRMRLARVGVALLFCIMALTPWMIRNFNLTGSVLVSSISTYAFVMFTTTPATAPPGFYTPLTTVSYNGHTNQVWYAYSALAYPMLVTAKHDLLAHLDYRSFVTRQLVCTPSVWFGFLAPKDEEAYGHEYALIADFVGGQNVGRDAILDTLDTAAWTVLLALTLLGTFLLLRNPLWRFRFLPLLCILLITLFLNFCASWVRVVLPSYPIILIATGIATDFLIRTGRRQP